MNQPNVIQLEIVDGFRSFRFVPDNPVAVALARSFETDNPVEIQKLTARAGYSNLVDITASLVTLGLPNCLRCMFRKFKLEMTDMTRAIIACALAFNMHIRDELTRDVRTSAAARVEVIQILVDNIGLTLTPTALFRVIERLGNTSDLAVIAGIPEFSMTRGELRTMFIRFSVTGNFAGRAYILTRYRVCFSFLDNADWVSTALVPWDLHARIMIMMYDNGSRDFKELVAAGGNPSWILASFRTFVAFGPDTDFYSAEKANDLFFADKDGYFWFVASNRARRSLGFPNVPDVLLRGVLRMLH